MWSVFNSHAGSCTEALTALQADINQQADEYEEVLRRSRAKMEAASQELRDWELQTARARNEGTFFKGLFKADVLQPPSDESRATYEQEPLPEVHIPASRKLMSGWWDAAEHLDQRAVEGRCSAAAMRCEPKALSAHVLTCVDLISVIDYSTMEAGVPEVRLSGGASSLWSLY